MTAVSPVCRSCGEPHLEPILALGRLPLANALLTREQLGQPERTYPLELVFCKKCSLVQITETVPPENLFGDYLYFSSFSNTMLRHAEELVTRLVTSRGLHGSSLAVEIGSNDGYLLQYYQQLGVPVLGVEPAENVARVAKEKHCVPTLCKFFSEDLAEWLRAECKRADVVHAHNVLAHVPDLNGFTRGLQRLLKADAIAVIEVPYVKDLVDRCEFDTIYHEHLCYFSLTSLDRLFRSNGLVIENVERLPIHGGSLRLFVTLQGSAHPSPAVRTLLEEETVWGVNRLDFYRGFARRVESLKTSLRGLLRELKQSGKRLAAYGAAAKGSTLLNYCGIGAETLDFVVDRSSYKQGRYMPGVQLPIYRPAQLLEAMPDYVLLLTWNFTEEILTQQAEYRRRGGHLVIPIPEPRVL